MGKLQNVGSMDRLVRFGIAAIALIVAALAGSEIAWVIGGLVAAIMVITGLTSVCPIWIGLGVNTRSKKGNT